MAMSSRDQCAYCRSPIGPGERWTREKITARTISPDLFAGEEISCWEKHQMELEIVRTTARAA